MQTLILANQTEVPILGCQGHTEYFQGAQRDVLDFRIDPAVKSLDEADALFTPANLARVTIREEITETVQETVQETIQVEKEVTLEDGTTETQLVDQVVDKLVDKEVTRTEEFVHENYQLRVSLSKQKFDVPMPDGKTEQQEMVSVKMAQKSSEELTQEDTQGRVTALEDALAQTDEAAIELYEAQAAQEEINNQQDDALLEIYEMIGG